ncbi:hypothetical protein VKS41_006533 [Umbelopsis sp. WA50703]
MFNLNDKLNAPMPFFRGNRRYMVASLALLILTGISLLSYSRSSGLFVCNTGRNIRYLSSEAAAMTAAEARTAQYTFTNLNALTADPQSHVLILTPLKNAEAYLPRYFELVNQLTYPKELISLSFLVSDTNDRTVDMLRQFANENRQFHHVSILERDFNYELPEDKRHTFELQPLRRSMMARSRNYLLTASLRTEHAWVVWLDVDVVEYPPTILEDLMSVDVDVVVPNCLWDTQDGSFWGYDKNNWQETEESLAIQKDLDDDYVLLEGYYEFLTARKLMVDMPTHNDKFDKVELDGVGATFTLVKAEVHREGANFPAYPFQHEVETEGFAKMAKAMGFGVYGLPGYIIKHIYNN